MQLRSARYLPWERVGHPAVEPDARLDSEQAAHECARLFAILGAAIGEPDAHDTSFQIEGQAIVGPAQPGKRQLSSSFSYRELLAHEGILPLPLRLLWGLQLLRYRWNRSLTITGFEPRPEGGARGLHVRAKRGKRDRDALLTVAREIAALGCYFETAEAIDDDRVALTL